MQTRSGPGDALSRVDDPGPFTHEYSLVFCNS